MRALLSLPVGWLQGGLATIRRGPAWCRRLTYLILLVAMVAAYWASGYLRPWPQGVLWITLLLAAALYLRRHPLRLFGPVLPFDLIRTARQTRFFLLRGLYAAALLLILSWVYVSWFRERGGGLAVLFQGGVLDIRETAHFAESFFVTFSWVQFLAVLLFTPVYVAGGVTEEKERRTLEYLLASDLTSREIVLGKLVSRLCHLLFVLFAGLPVIACIEFLGGVDPRLAAAGFCMTAITMISLGSLSILMSVYTRRVLEAVFWTYVWFGLYLIASSWFSYTYAWVYLLIASTPPDIYTLGNPLVALAFLFRELASGRELTAVLVDLIHDYALYHGLVVFFCCFWATRKLRLLALRVDAPKPLWRRPGFDFPPRRRRPKLRDRPLLWKEVHGEAPLGSERFSALVVYFYLVLGWLLAAGYLFGLSTAQVDDFRDLAEQSNLLAYGLGNLLAVAMLLAVGVYAAGCVSRERERQTLDSLLALPVDSDAILFAKWLGSILSVRPVAGCLGIIWGVGLLTGGLHVLAVLLLLAVWIGYAAFLASLGLCLSIYCRSTLRAVVWTLLTVVVLAVGCRLMGAHGDLFFGPWLPPEASQAVSNLFGCGLAPFTSFYLMSFHYAEFPNGGKALDRLLAVLAGIGIYGLAAQVLWRIARRAFRSTANREPRRGLPPFSSEPPVSGMQAARGPLDACPSDSLAHFSGKV